MLTSSEIRRQFIDFFVSRHGHTVVPSSPVVPHNDPTLLFTNAGMNQFKDIFLGIAEGGGRPYTRAVNTQKCIRAGGKHNDLEDVGQSPIHQTFFEMLGNWSFGDYFKEQAIAWAWQLLTEVWGLPKDRLHATVFEGDVALGLQRDEEAAELWRQVTDINPAHIHYGSKKDNFWEMGETGPCGPCSEIHIDRTPDKSGLKLVNGNDPRVLELWNLVFIQYNRDTSGELSPLPARHVDTGMGFERICAVLQNKQSNYDTDVFAPIFSAIKEVTGARPYSGKPGDKIDTAYRVIADHVRCLTFALTDGAVPSNEGRGYVLRRILRRAVRHGYQTLGVQKAFVYQLVPAVVEAMGAAFVELTRNPQKVADLIREEEESFGRTLDRGIALFEDAATSAGNLFLTQPNVVVSKTISTFCHTELYRLGRSGMGTWDTAGFNWQKCPCDKRPQISAEDAFKLHDTYGFPLDLTQVMARERGMTVDVAGFNTLMEEARQLARQSGSGQGRSGALLDIVQKEAFDPTEFVGYEETACSIDSYCMLYRISDQKPKRLAQAVPGDQVAVVVARTPFYAEAGGQVGDRGTIVDASGNRLRVSDTVRVGDIILHMATVEAGTWKQCLPAEANDWVRLTLKVDADRRERIMANHTTTHMMNRALRKHVSPTADQKGSLVDDEKLRFDFSHGAHLTLEQIDRVEQMVNADIAADLPVDTGIAAQAEALKITGLRAVFGERYPEMVRVVSIGQPVDTLLGDPDNAQWADLSIEFCGGTHLKHTGQAEHFVILSEEAVAKGVRRITALTGRAAREAADRGQQLAAQLAQLKQVAPDQLADKLGELIVAIKRQPVPALAAAQLRDGIAQLQKIVKVQQKEAGKQVAGAVVEQARQLAEQCEGDVMVACVPGAGADAQTLRSAMDVIRKKKPNAALLLAAVGEGKVAFVASVPQPLIDKGLKAGDWVRQVAQVTGGSGGGRPDMAQAGGKQPAKLDEALEVGRKFAASKL